jgi:hypothetical protein
VYTGGGICAIALVTNNKRTTAVAKHRILFFSRIRRDIVEMRATAGCWHLGRAFQHCMALASTNTSFSRHIRGLAFPSSSAPTSRSSSFRHVTTSFQ